MVTIFTQSKGRGELMRSVATLVERVVKRQRPTGAPQQPTLRIHFDIEPTYGVETLIHAFEHDAARYWNVKLLATEANYGCVVIDYVIMNRDPDSMARLKDELRSGDQSLELAEKFGIARIEVWDSYRANGPCDEISFRAFD